MKRFPRLSVDRPEQQAIYPRSPTHHRESRREDLARDLEAVASKRGAPTESELLADLLRRVERIEEHLGITN
jgi:hypothetical protein